MSEPKGGDRIPTDAELDALQAQIEAAQADARPEPVTPAPREGREPLGMEPIPNQRESGQDGAEHYEDSKALPSDVAAQRVLELEAEMATLKDRALRALADADNTKKRAEREVTNAKTYGIERFAGDMLGVYDNLSRALASVDDVGRDTLGDNAKNLLDGLELTEKSLIAALSRHGVKPGPGVGSKFDPNHHQAVAQIPSTEVAKGEVAEVMQGGFTLGDRTLRAAMVAVSTGPAKMG